VLPQAGVLVGEDVEAILVDVIPHSLGISAAVSTPMGIMPGFFSDYSTQQRRARSLRSIPP